MRQACRDALVEAVVPLDVGRWLGEHGSDPYSEPSADNQRNEHWQHLANADVISMPDKWETPGLRPGTWPFHSLALVRLTRPLPRASWS